MEGGDGQILLTVVGENKHGKVIIRREKNDGTAVLLVCDEFESLSDAAGPVILPEPDENGEAERKTEEPPPGETVFPLFVKATAMSRASDRPLVVDISEMPRGTLLFKPEQFTRGAIAALQSGADRVVLNEESAREFGFTRALSHEEVLEL